MVYVIEAINGDVSTFKIGFTVKQNPRVRLGQIQRNNPLPLRLVAGLIGTKKDEEMFHHVFKDFRLHGEWFEDCVGIRALISDFPIETWDMTIQKLRLGRTTPEVAYHDLTLLKFENPGSKEWEEGWRDFKEKWAKT